MTARSHKCPGCRGSHTSRTLYCSRCIKAYPKSQYGRYMYRRPGRWLRGKRLPGVYPSTTKLMVSLDGMLLCLECGGRFLHNKKTPPYKHRCYVHPNFHSLVCRRCHGRKSRTDFPIIQHRGYNVRALVCVQCVNGVGVIMSVGLEGKV